MTTHSYIDIANIEKELELLYKQNGNGNATRAGLFNFIIYSPDKERSPELLSVIKRTTELFPCRILFIQHDPDKEGSHLKVSVSTEKIGRSDGKVLCDLIQIEVSASALDRIPFLILPHLVPDLPIYLLWGQDPTLPNAILPDLLKIAKRLIFDSHWANNLQELSQRLLKLFQTSKFEGIDLAWACLSGWREVLAQAFDAPEKLLDLKNAKEIKITYNGQGQPSRLTAIYLQGWLAAQLDWQFLAKEHYLNEIVLAYASPIHEISVRLIPVDRSDLKLGAISKFELSSFNGDSYFLEKQPNASKVLLHLASSSSCELPCTLQLPKVDRGFNYMKELFYFRQSEHYLNMLQMIGQVNWEN